MKYFLVINNPQYYPSCGTSNWYDCYETIEEAEEVVLELEKKNPDGSQHIVDLRKWIGEEKKENHWMSSNC